MAESTGALATAERSAPPTLVPLQWVVWPLPINASRGSLTILAGSLLVFFAVRRITGSGELAALAWGAAALASWRLWLPVRYELSFQGLTQRLLGRESRLAWPAIGRAEMGANGVWLWSHDDGAGRRSLGFLPWGENRQQVLAWFESRRLLGREVIAIEPASQA